MFMTMRERDIVFKKVLPLKKIVSKKTNKKLKF